MIVPSLAKMLIREHMFRPITGKVLCLGRQTIAMTLDEATAIFKDEGISIPHGVIEEARKDLNDTMTRSGKYKKNLITDETFFKMFGLSDLKRMDVSKYEGADIIHNMNYPVPDSLEEKFDFILDGGVFDHLVSFSNAFSNVARMLKPGGRVFQWNVASCLNWAAYSIVSPDLFHDYYVYNNFVDCKIYLAENNGDPKEKFKMYLLHGGLDECFYYTKKRQIIIAFAEKGNDSTYDHLPVQAQYREEHLWDHYRTREQVIKESARKPWTGRREFDWLGKKLGKFVRSVLGIESFFINGYKSEWLDKKLDKFICRQIDKRLIKVLNRLLNRYLSGKKGYEYLGKI
jgi:SAM-dependent methyltransferase